MWEDFLAIHGGVLVVGHGTRVVSGTEQLIALADQLQVLIPQIPVEPSFLELARPTIADAVSCLKLRGVRKILVVPILLFEAAHALEDIPAAVKTAADWEGLSIFAQSPPLGSLKAALELSELRFTQALRCRAPTGCLLAGACPRYVECLGSAPQPAIDQTVEGHGRIGFAMVGRGTSDPSAIEHMRRFARLRIEGSKTPIAWTQTGFFAGEEPSVEALLRNAASSGCDTIIVQPHLLFEGELVGKLRQKVEVYQRNSLVSRWLVTPVLGADPALASAFFSLASETLRRHLPANS